MTASVELSELAERVAGWARPDEQVEAYVARYVDTDIRVFKGDVESLSSAETEGVGVRVVAGHRQGFAYAGSLEEQTLAEALADARDNAGFGTEDEYLGLPEPDGVARAHLELFRPQLATFPAERKVALALELERATKAADVRIRGVQTCGYGDTIAEIAIASSTGIRTVTRRTVCSIYALAMAGEGIETQTGYGYSVARCPDDLDLSKAAGDAAYRATRLLGARQPASQRLTVVLEPMMTASLLAVLSSTFNGEAVLKGRSLFAGRVGEKVAAPRVTLIEDPTNPEAYGAAPNDAEGLATRRTSLIEDGVLQGFLQNTYTGRRSGVGSTGSAVRGFKSTPGVGARALSLAPGERSLDELMTQVDQGLLVQSMTGLHSGVNTVSGDFSVGIEGLVIRGGALAEPVREATMASTLQQMLGDVSAVGSDVEWLPTSAAGVTLVIEGISISGT